MANVRGMVVEELYNLCGDGYLYREKTLACDTLIAFIKDKLSDEDYEQALDMICEADKQAFSRGMILIFDLINGKEIE